MVDVTNATLGQKDKGKGKGNRKAEKKPTISYLQAKISILTCEFQNYDVLTSFNQCQMCRPSWPTFVFTTLLHS
jgi:hypothetical protein